MAAKKGVLYFKMVVSGEPTKYDNTGHDGMYVESIEKTDIVAKLKKTLQLITEVQISCAGYRSECVCYKNAQELAHKALMDVVRNEKT